MDSLSQKEADLLGQLSPEEIKAIMKSVMGEMVQGLQVCSNNMLQFYNFTSNIKFNFDSLDFYIMLLEIEEQ